MIYEAVPIIAIGIVTDFRNLSIRNLYCVYIITYYEYIVH